jgi:hypothetical protein
VLARGGDRQSPRKGGARLSRANVYDRHLETKRLGALDDERGVAEQIERRKLQFTPAQPGEKRNIGSDARGFTQRQCQWLIAWLPGLVLHRSICFRKPQKVTGDDRKRSIAARL